MKEAQKQMGDYNKLTEQQKENYRALSVEITKSENAIKKMNSELKNTNKIDLTKVGESLKKVGDIAEQVIKKVAQVVTGVSTAMVGVVAYSAKVGSEFEASMSKVQAISGATGDDLDRLSEKAKEMGANTKFSASESAEALQYMAMAGWKTNDMVDGLEGIMNLAAASGEELATTSDIVTDALTAFGMQANESSHFADILATASSNSNTNVSLMGETFKYVGSIAGSLKYSAEDTALAIGLMANAGIKASQAGTSLRSIMSRLATNTNGCRADLEQLGITVVNADGSMRPFGEVIKDLREKFKGLSAEEQSNIAKSVAGQNALSGFLAIANSGDADFEKLSNAINNCNGSAKEMAEIMQDNLQGQITILKSNLEGLGIQIYESLEGTFKNVVGNITGYIQELATAFEKDGVVGLTQAVGNVLGSMIAKIVEFAPKFIDSAILIVQNLIIGIQNNLPVIVNGAIEIMSSLLLGIVNMLPKIVETGLQIIIALAKGIAEKIPELMPTIVNVVLEIVNVLLDNIDLIIEAAIQIMVALTEGIMNALPDLLARLPEIIIKICSTLLNLLPQILSTGLRIIAEIGLGIIRGIPDLISKIPRVITSIVNALKQGFSKMFDIGKNLVKGLWNGISGSLSWIKDKITGWVGNVMNFIKKLFGIHSPSTVMRDVIGVNLTKGIGKGFEKGMPDTLRDVNKAMSQLNTEVKASINPVINPSARIPTNSSLVGQESAVNNITLNFQLPANASPSEYARQVRKELQYLNLMKG